MKKITTAVLCAFVFFIFAKDSFAVDPLEALRVAYDSAKTKEARDQMYDEYVKSLQGSGIGIHATYDSFKQAIGDRRVVVLGGFSGLGYQDPEVVKSHIRDLMTKNGDGVVYVIGGTSDGIGQAYDWIPQMAKDMGLKDVKTAGITSREAARWGVAKQDYVLFVDTPPGVWEVKQGDRSLMVKVAEDAKGEMVYFKGGKVSKVEIEEGLSHGVPVTVVADPKVQANTKKVAKKLPKTADGQPRAPESVTAEELAAQDETKALTADGGGRHNLRVSSSLKAEAKPTTALGRVLGGSSSDDLSKAAAAQAKEGASKGAALRVLSEAEMDEFWKKLSSLDWEGGTLYDLKHNLSIMRRSGSSASDIAAQEAKVAAQEAKVKKIFEEVKTHIKGSEFEKLIVLAKDNPKVLEELEQALLKRDMAAIDQLLNSKAVTQALEGTYKEAKTGLMSGFLRKVKGGIFGIAAAALTINQLKDYFGDETRTSGDNPYDVSHAGVAR